MSDQSPSFCLILVMSTYQSYFKSRDNSIPLPCSVHNRIWTQHEDVAAMDVTVSVLWRLLVDSWNEQRKKEKLKNKLIHYAFQFNYIIPYPPPTHRIKSIYFGCQGICITSAVVGGWELRFNCVGGGYLVKWGRSDVKEPLNTRFKRMIVILLRISELSSSSPL